MEEDWTRDPKGHKGTFGTVLVIGGADESLSMLGGPVLAGLAAYRVGSGKVVIGLPRTLIHSALELLPEALCFDYAKEEMLAEQLEHATSIVVGPGWGQSDTQKELLSLILKISKPTILDADALNMLDETCELHSKCILTPHPGEFKRLAAVFDVTTPAELSVKTHAVVIYKDSKTILIDAARVYEHDQPNDKLAIAGSGDVLSGILGGLCAQYPDKSLYDVAVRGVQLHAAAGEQVQHGSLASELADKVQQREND